MSHRITCILLCLAVLALAAPASAYTVEQAASGKELYGKSCAACHGANGEGGIVPDQFTSLKGKAAPALVGPGALRAMKKLWHLFDFTTVSMPADKPGSLKGHEYRDIISYLGQVHGIKPDGVPLTPEWVLMPPGMDLQKR